MEKRFIITSSDLVKLTGYCERWAQKRLNLIKCTLGKTKDQFITIKEFCEYEMMNETDVRKFLNICE